jgi:peptide/nickel transport system permease protein
MKKRHRFMLQRLGLMLFSIWLIVTLLFIIFRLAPGTPADMITSPTMTAEARQRLLELYGLDRPLWEQYVAYMKNLVTGEFGRSFRNGQLIGPMLFERTFNTIVITLPAVLIAFTIGPLIGSTFAWNRGEPIDTYGTAAILFAYAAPIFWTGMIAIAVFSFWLEMLPSAGMRSAGVFVENPIKKVMSVDFLRHAALPIAIFSLWRLSQPTLFTRNNMIDVLGSDFIQLKRAEGIPELTIQIRHAMRNALLPVVHYGALAMASAFGGSVILESVFSWPGLGRAIWQAALSADYPVAQAGFFMMASIVIMFNFFADIVSVYLDPRLASEGSEVAR